MPVSNKAGKKEVRAFLLESFPPEARVLDVGAGSGTYHALLGDYFKNMDACEVYAPYIKKYDLEKKYGKVFNQSVVEFQNFDDYDIILFGDVLEHITVDDSQAILERCKNVKQVMIAVPFEYHQGAAGGVESERHLQDDLTPELVTERYPGFEPLYLLKRRSNSKARNSFYSYGYYFRVGTLPEKK